MYVDCTGRKADEWPSFSTWFRCSLIITMKFSSLAILGLSSSFNLVKGSAGALESSPESTQTVALVHDESVSKPLEGMGTHQGVMQYPHRLPSARRSCKTDCSINAGLPLSRRRRKTELSP